MNKGLNNSSFLNDVHKYGRVWNFTMAGVLILFPIVLCIIFSVTPNWSGLVKGLIATLPMYWAVGIVEVLRIYQCLARAVRTFRSLRAISVT